MDLATCSSPGVPVVCFPGVSASTEDPAHGLVVLPRGALDTPNAGQFGEQVPSQPRDGLAAQAAATVLGPYPQVEQRSSVVKVKQPDQPHALVVHDDPEGPGRTAVVVAVGYLAQDCDTIRPLPVIRPLLLGQEAGQQFGVIGGKAPVLGVHVTPGLLVARCSGSLICPGLEFPPLPSAPRRRALEEHDDHEGDRNRRGG
jgi:hypothetical protein